MNLVGFGRFDQEESREQDGETLPQEIYGGSAWRSCPGGLILISSTGRPLPSGCFIPATMRRPEISPRDGEIYFAAARPSRATSLPKSASYPRSGRLWH